MAPSRGGADGRGGETRLPPPSEPGRRWRLQQDEPGRRVEHQQGLGLSVGLMEPDRDALIHHIAQAPCHILQGLGHIVSARNVLGNQESHQARSPASLPAPSALVSKHQCLVPVPLVVARSILGKTLLHQVIEHGPTSLEPKG